MSAGTAILAEFALVKSSENKPVSSATVSFRSTMVNEKNSFFSKPLIYFFNNFIKICIFELREISKYIGS